ncbi:MAG: hypothetical protein M1820_000980 [Bogoriella megaspora]|nr:MAG: hypothetical protein M1820_000980 [Bogoriella megaspora]
MPLSYNVPKSPPGLLLRARTTQTGLIEVYVQSASTLTAPQPGLHPFERKVEDVKLSKADINFVIMDYLINEGYPTAAKNFAAEANILPIGDTESIQERVEIRDAIHSGDIQTAIEKINDLNPEILDTDSSLHFALLQLQLIELIRTSMSSSSPDITPVLNFASAQLAPHASTNPKFLSDLEQTMALLIYPPDNLTPQLSALLDPQLRRDVATRINEAILTRSGNKPEARITTLIRLRAWAETKAREGASATGREIDLPARLSIGLDKDKNDGDGQAENGESDAMVT